MVWFDDARIERTVTRQFVASHLLPEEILRLDRPLGFGDGLTDGTYWEWIDQKAKKIFLILYDLGVPDQIFGVIDDSWDDDDLPIARDHVERLALLPTPDDRFDRKFYLRQFYYLLKPLERSDAVAVYDDMDVVPIDIVSSSTTTPGHHRSGSSEAPAAPSSSDRVVLPNYPGMVFRRRRIPLAQLPNSAYGQPHGQGYMTLQDFEYEIATIKNIQNDHLVSYWTSYVHQGCGYVLFTPAADSSVKSLLATTPASVKNLEKKDRRRLVFNWIHCLVDTLCYVHRRGLHHGNIKPSNILLAFQHHTGDNHVFFSDFTQFASASESGDKASFSKESYDYAAPEQWYRPSAASGGGTAAPGTSSGGSSRKSLISGEGGSGGRGAGMSMYAGSVYGDKEKRKESMSTSLSMSPEHASPTGYAFQMGASGSFNISRSSTAGLASSANNSNYNTPAPQLNAQAADIFSLGCIILELMTFMLKRQTRAFATHRAAKHKTPGRGGAVLDSSFHKNLGQVESWMAALAKDASTSLSKNKNNDTTLAGVAPMLHVVERMLALHASERPSAYDVQTRMYQILRDYCGILEPHCVHEYGSLNAAWVFGTETETDFVEKDNTESDYDYASPRLATSFSNMSLSSGAVSPTTNVSGGGYSWSSGAQFPHSPSLGSSMGTNANSTWANGATSPGLGLGLSRAGSFSYLGQGQGQTPSGRRLTQSVSAPSQHMRVDSSGGSSARSSTIGGVGASVILEEDDHGDSPETEKGKEKPEPINGLQAIRNIQIRDKVRQSWNSPVYAS